MNVLKRLRGKRKITQKELSDNLKMSVSHYVKIENGFMDPSYNVMKKLKEFYGDELNLNELVK